jgi:hypothetical protein
MGNLSKKDRADLHARYTTMLDKISDAIVRSGRFIVEEGVTVGFGVMLWRITGEVKQYDDDGAETPEWAIRTAILKGLVNVRQMLLTEIPLIGIAPNSWLEPIVRAYEQLLVRSDTQPNRYLALPMVERLEMVILIPGLFRMMMEMVKGLLSK